MLAAMAAGLAAPDWAFAAAPERIPLSQAFKYLADYLALPPALRNRFHLVFRAMRDDKPAADLKAAIVSPRGGVQPLPMDAHGDVLRLPTLAQLRSDDELEVRGGAFRFITEIRPDLPPSTHIDVGQLDAAMAQATSAVAHIAGAFSAMAPKLDTVLFPDAGSGEVVFADGHAQPLPVSRQYRALGPVPYYRSTTEPGARSVALARVPSRLLISAPPKA
jgi:hypothetical protein